MPKNTLKRRTTQTHNSRVLKGLGTCGKAMSQVRKRLGHRLCCISGRSSDGAYVRPAEESRRADRMMFIYWLPTTLLPTLYMLPMMSVAGMLSTSPSSAPTGSLQGDLE
jgi:hypothetical protein